ncbi:MAG TPA: presenilin family intramembrane aspartyl protease PSH, partial [Thermoplasmata archaeon]|nr:presenilin family intramembrane aspartyl protease PSH [Thermoplasmata archaeon]
GIRSIGLLLLYIGAQIVALALAFPFLSEGLSTTTSSTANNPYGPIYIIVLIVVAPLGILFLARRERGPQALRLVILVGIAFALAITLDATFTLFLPPAAYVMPYGAAEAVSLADPLAAIVAVGILLALLIQPEWYVVDAAGFLAAGSLIAILGITFGPLPAFILLGALAIYDYIAVYRTKHMLSLADVVVDMKLPILMVMPGSAGYDYPNAPSLKARRTAEGGPPVEREALFMGLGDVVIPGTLVVSAFVWLPEHPVILGVGPNLLVAAAALLGSLLGYGALMRLVNKGRAQAGLPFLNGGALAGYVLAFVLVYHSLGLGLGLGI